MENCSFGKLPLAKASLKHSFEILMKHFLAKLNWQIIIIFKKMKTTVCSDAGISLKHVAAHEFGHALGLSHLPHKEVLNH